MQGQWLNPYMAKQLHQYLCHTAADYKETRGFTCHTYPSLKTQEDQDALWRGILTGSLSTVATDDCPTSLEGQACGEHNRGRHRQEQQGAEARMGIVYTEGVTKRAMTLQRFVDVTSTNAAKIFRLYPRKGAIAVGSDADLVLMDTSLERKLTKAVSMSPTTARGKATGRHELAPRRRYWGERSL